MASSEVDGFVSRLARGWQQEVCIGLLAATRAVRPRLDESIKWRNPYFSGRGAVVKWYCAKGWITVYFYRGSELDDASGAFEASANKRLRALRYTRERRHADSVYSGLLAQAVLLDLRGHSE